MRVDGQLHAPAAIPPEMTRYSLYRRLGEPQGRSGRLRKISPPPGLDPRTVQPVAIRYTDYAIPALTYQVHRRNKSFSDFGIVAQKTAWITFVIKKLIVPQLVEKFAALFWNPKFHCRVHKSSPLNRTMNYMNPSPRVR
jgi:hypothetical protein